jgi:hypothetical protein
VKHEVVPVIDDFVPEPMENEGCGLRAGYAVNAGSLRFWRIHDRGERHAHCLGELGEFAADCEQFLLFCDASAAGLSHCFFERCLSREQFKKLVD